MYTFNQLQEGDRWDAFKAGASKRYGSARGFASRHYGSAKDAAFRATGSVKGRVGKARVFAKRKRITTSPLADFRRARAFGKHAKEATAEWARRNNAALRVKKGVNNTILVKNAARYAGKDIPLRAIRNKNYALAAGKTALATGTAGLAGYGAYRWHKSRKAKRARQEEMFLDDVTRNELMEALFEIYSE